MCIGVETFQMCFILPSTSWSRLRDLINIHSLNFVMLSYSLSLASVFLSLYPFKSSLKTYQSTLLTLAQKSFFPQRNVYTIKCQQAWCCMDHPTTEKSKILPVTLAFQQYIDQLDLPAHFNIVSCYWKVRGKNTCASDPLTSLPNALKSLFIDLGLLFATSSLPM